MRTGETYGWNIVDNDDSKTLSKRSIYIELSRMEDKGFVVSRKEEVVPGARGLPKRNYRITGLGQRALAAVELFEGGGDVCL